MDIVLVFVVFGLFIACKNNRIIETERMVREWMGQTIKIPDIKSTYVTIKDSLKHISKIDTTAKKYKILFYVDSINCGKCKLNMDMWKSHIYDNEGNFKTNIPLNIGVQEIMNIDNKKLLLRGGDSKYNIYLCDYTGNILEQYSDRYDLPTAGSITPFVKWIKNTVLFHIDFSNSVICYDKATNQFSEIDLFCNKELFLSKEKEFKLKKQNNAKNANLTFEYLHNSKLNLIGTLTSYSDYLLIFVRMPIHNKWSQYIVDKNNKIQYHYNTETINDISFSKQFEICSETEDCFIGYDYIDLMFESMEQQKEKLKDNQHFVSLYKELSEIKNREEENPVLIELKIE